MSVDKFKFVSPGVFIDEVDESGIPALPERMGPMVIGRFQKGPGKRPIRVNSYKEFVQLFGDPSPGTSTGDVWRNGESTAPTYAAYAVKAWLRNNSPCTVYRVLGENSSLNDGTATAQAGWITDNDYSADIASAGGAYGLFIFPSGSEGDVGECNSVTGTLAAVWYVQDGAVILTGSAYKKGDTKVEGAGTLIRATGTKFTAKIIQNGTSTSDATVLKTATFNFDRDSDQFIRKVFNTDPTKTNSSVNSTTEAYWLGETFESNVRNSENSKLKTQSADGLGTVVGDGVAMHGVILRMDNTDDGDSETAVVKWHNRQQAARAAQTGWFFSQDTRGETSTGFVPESHTQKLFKFHALDSGEHANRDYKVSIQDIRVPTDNFNKFTTFTVVIRRSGDTDNNPVFLERYTGLNLDPTSANYIARAIGDRYYTYDEDNRRIVEHGDNENRSKILRVELDPTIKNGGGEGMHPFGVYGPAVQKTVELNSESTGGIGPAVGSGSSAGLPTGSLTSGHLAGGTTIWTGDSPGATGSHFTASIEMPTTRLRVSSSEGFINVATKAYFGYNSSIKNTRRFDRSNFDLLRGQPANLDPTASPSNLLQYSWVFTLDDVGESGADSSHAVWVSGSRAAGDSFTAASASGDSAGVPFVLSKGFDQFTSPLFGGFDGFDVTEPDPFRNSKMVSPTEINNSSFYSLKKAIDVTSDTDFLEYDLLTMPGVTNSSLNTQLVNSAEDRADCLAIIDVEGGYKPPHENTNSEEDNVGDVTTTVNNLKDLNFNSSYGCTFYPWVKIRDTLADSILYVPPSVVALGTFSSAQRKSAVWFAPAGFTRGGLSEGSAGLPVLGVRQRLTSNERDKLYDANINPIASFPAEGVVIFGQKTLQVTPSALDRINVRRLLIYLKKEISRIASRILFDQNVQQTWDRFTGQVIPFLEGVQAGLGLTDFKVVLDDTTTTPDLVDRNILYAKIFLKPARAIEFIALDFIITRSGASFDD